MGLKFAKVACLALSRLVSTLGPRLYSANFRIKRNTFVVVQPFVYMTTVCRCPGNCKHLRTDSRVELQPSLRLCELAKKEVTSSPTLSVTLSVCITFWVK